MSGPNCSCPHCKAAPLLENFTPEEAQWVQLLIGANMACNAVVHQAADEGYDLTTDEVESILDIAFDIESTPTNLH